MGIMANCMPVAHPHIILAAYRVLRFVATPASSHPSRRGRLDPIMMCRRPTCLDSGTVMRGPGDKGLIIIMNY